MLNGKRMLSSFCEACAETGAVLVRTIFISTRTLYERNHRFLGKQISALGRVGQYFLMGAYICEHVYT